MSSYPINIDAKAVQALVIGAGEVGHRKIETLLLQGVESIKVLDKNIKKDDFSFKDNAHVLFFEREFDNADLESCNLVFVATENKELNSTIALECKNRNIFCNVVTNPAEGSFSLPALVRKEELLITLSTNGLSPALSRALKEDIEIFLDKGYADLCAFLGRLRPEILKLDLPTKENTKIFRTFVTSPYKDVFLSYFNEKNEENTKAIHNLIAELFPQTLQTVIIGALC